LFLCRERMLAVFLRLASPAWLLLVAAGCSYHGPVCGLRPYFPDVVAGAYRDSLIFAEAGSLQPFLRWETFPRPSDLRDDRQGMIAGAQCVTYELRIWRVEDPGTMRMVYERRGISAPRHRVEDQLDPDSRYFWSVRAKFRVGDQTRVIPWGFSKVPHIPNLVSCIVPGNIPPGNYYRFQTPAK